MRLESLSNCQNIPILNHFCPNYRTSPHYATYFNKNRYNSTSSRSSPPLKGRIGTALSGCFIKLDEILSTRTVSLRLRSRIRRSFVRIPLLKLEQLSLPKIWTTYLFYGSSSSIIALPISFCSRVQIMTSNLLETLFRKLRAYDRNEKYPWLIPIPTAKSSSERFYCFHSNSTF